MAYGNPDPQTREGGNREHRIKECPYCGEDLSSGDGWVDFPVHLRNDCDAKIEVR